MSAKTGWTNTLSRKTIMASKKPLVIDFKTKAHFYVVKIMKAEGHFFSKRTTAVDVSP